MHNRVQVSGFRFQVSASLFAALLCMSVLSGCVSQSKIQTTYIRQQNTCREEAQAAVESSTTTAPDGSTIPSGDPALSLATRFSECMNKTGWHVATPKQPGTPVAQNPTPPNTLDPSKPPAISSSARRPAPAETAQNPSVINTLDPNKPPAISAAARQPAVDQPIAPSSAPGTVATPQTITGESPASYQPVPARPGAVPSTSYGTGAGRQF